MHKGVATGSLAASWEASGGSIFAALRTFGVSGISGAVAAGLGAAFGSAAVVLTAFFNKKKPEKTETVPEPIEETPVLATSSAHASTECAPRIEKHDEQEKKEEKPVDEEISAKKTTDISFQADCVVQRSEAKAEIMSIPVSKASAEEEVLPMQSEVHYAAVQAIENQIVQPVAANVEREEVVVEEEEVEEEEEAVVCFPTKPLTFTEQILAAREVVDSISPRSLSTQSEPTKTPEREVSGEEEEEEIVAKIAASAEAAPVREIEKMVEGNAVVNNIDVIEVLEAQMVEEEKCEEPEIFIAKTVATVEVSRTVEEPQKVEEEEEWEEEEDEEVVVEKVIAKAPAEVAQTKEPEKKVEEEEEYEEYEEEEEEEEVIIEKKPSSAVNFSQPQKNEPEETVEDEEEEYEEEEEEEIVKQPITPVIASAVPTATKPVETKPVAESSQPSDAKPKESELEEFSWGNEDE